MSDSKRFLRQLSNNSDSHSDQRGKLSMPNIARKERRCQLNPLHSSFGPKEHAKLREK